MEEQVRQTSLYIYQLSKGRCETGARRAVHSNEGQRCLETDGWSQQSLTLVTDMKNILFSSNLSSRTDHLISLTDHFVYFCRFVFIVTTQIVVVLLW